MSSNWQPYAEYILEMSVYAFGIFTLYYTIITDFLQENYSQGGVGTGLHVSTCVVTTWILFKWNQAENCLKLVIRAIVFFILELVGVGRFCRSSRLFMRNSVEDRNQNMEEKANGVVRILNVELEINTFDILEYVIRGVPMAGLQAYFLYALQKEFLWGSLKDLLRLATIITPLLCLAYAVAKYEYLNFEYKQNLQLLNFYRKPKAFQSAYPVPTISRLMLWITRICSILCHASTIVHRFYAAMYFLFISPVLCVIYLDCIYLGNIAILIIFPFLEDKYHNHPIGVSTFPRYLLNRVINIFCNVGTRFNKFTDEIRLKCGEKDGQQIGIRLPIFVLQIIHLIPAIALYHGSDSKLFSRTVPHVANKTWSNGSGINHAFTGFGDLFQHEYMLWGFFGVQMVFSVVYAFSDLFTKRILVTGTKQRTQKYLSDYYPTITARMHYQPVLNYALKEDFDSAEQLKNARKLMVLTCVKECEFYWWFPFPWFFRWNYLSDKKLDRITDDIIARISITVEQDLDMNIQNCISELEEMSHEFFDSFVKICSLVNSSDGDECQKLKDKKLLYGYLTDIDRNLLLMTSDRLRKLYAIMGCRLEVKDFERL